MFSLEREQLQWLICIISLWNCYFNVFVRKYYCFTFEICLVVFFDLIDIYTDTKITKFGAFIAKLQAHPVFRAAILNFLRENPELRFGSRHFWIQHTRKPPDANFYASIRKCTPNSHIRPTSMPSLNCLFFYTLKKNNDKETDVIAVKVAMVDLVVELNLPLNTSVRINKVFKKYLRIQTLLKGQLKMFLFLVLSSSFLCLLFFFSVIRGRHVCYL